MCVHLVHKGGQPSSAVDARRAATMRPVPTDEEDSEPPPRHRPPNCAQRSSEAVARYLLGLAWLVRYGKGKGLDMDFNSGVAASKLTSTMLKRLHRS